MVSGAYFGALCTKVIQVAAQDNLFSSPLSDILGDLTPLSTKEINDFLLNCSDRANPLAAGLARGQSDDYKTMYFLLDHLIERAAKLTTIHLSAVVLKSEKGRSPLQPVCITAEGSVFYGLHSLKMKIEHYLKNYLIDQQGCYVEVANVENASLIGAAIAGLTN